MRGLRSFEHQSCTDDRTQDKQRMAVAGSVLSHPLDHHPLCKRTICAGQGNGIKERRGY